MKKTIACLLTLVIAVSLPLGAYASDTGKPDRPTVISSGYVVTAFVDQAGCLWMCGNTAHFPISVEGDRKNVYGAPIQSTPLKVMEHVRSVSLGLAFCGIIKDDGTLWMWGQTDNGVIGNGYAYDTVTETALRTAYRQSTPVQVLDRVTAISCGTCSAAAIREDGTLWMWGEVSRIGHGVKGNGKDTNLDYWPVQTVPIQIITDVAAVSCGRDITAVVKNDGSLWVWHHIEDDERGYTVHTASEPEMILDDVASVSCGADFLAAVKNDGSLWTYGSNSYGQLGTGGLAVSSSEAVKIMDGVKEAWAGDQSAAALCFDGTLWTWGENTLCALGNGEYHNSSMTPSAEERQDAPGKILENVSDACLNYGHGFALTDDGSVWAWGCNSSGELGNGFLGDYKVWWNGDKEYASPYQSSPVKIPRYMTLATAAGSAGAISVRVCGIYVDWTDAAPFIDENSRTMVPLRAVANALRLDVLWEAYTREASFSDGTKTIWFPIGSTRARTDDGIVEMDTAAVIVNDRSYAPVRYLAEFFGYRVDWEGETRTVVIEKAG